MDGLLIDSEDKYTICTNAILAKYGRPSLPWSIKAQLQGRPGPAAGAIFSKWAQLPISREQYILETSALQAQHFPTVAPLPGTQTLLETLETSKVHLALATSSHEANFKLKTGHLEEFFKPFSQGRRVLGDDVRIGQGRGKPAPDIYLLALETVNGSLGEGEKEIRPEECL
ncbi:Uncharacterized protein LSUE1_G008745, partial [Lachnellula suecica]